MVSFTEKLCKSDPKAVITTLIDYYGLPKDTPAIAYEGTEPFGAIVALEHALAQHIGQDNFIPNLVAHEFEGLLFSSPTSFSSIAELDLAKVEALMEIRRQFPSPEHIDDGRDTAPSKRILRVFPAYDKVLHGTLVALEIGLDVIRRECPKFNDWLTRLECLSPERRST